MHILIFCTGTIPAFKYGGTERVVWGLGKALRRLGCRVTYLAGAGSQCDFAPMLIYDPSQPLRKQIPAGVDLVHLHQNLSEGLDLPYVYTEHTNGAGDKLLPLNTIFISRDQARRYGGETFVHNGLEWDEYGMPDLDAKRAYFHFLGNAAWRVKNVRGAIDVVRGLPGEKLTVLGGHRLNIKMGFRLTLSPKVRFAGMVGGEEKLRLLARSKGLIFPVRWHEPFGLAIIESLYFGCPVFGTPYGSLPELVVPEVGTLSASCAELREAAKHADAYSRRACHDYAREMFSSDRMAANYMACYERVLNGEVLNPVPPQLRKAPGEGKFLPWNP